MPLHTFLLNTLCIITIALAVPLSASAYFGSGSNGANAGNNGSGNTSGGTTKSSSGGGADSSAKSTSGDKGAGVKSSSGGGGDNKPSGGGGNSYNGGYGSGGGNTGGGGGINNGSKGSTNNTPNSARDGRGGQPPSGKDPATGGGGGINNGSKGSTNNTPNSARDGRGGQPPSGKDPATGGGGGILGTISKVVTSLREATLGTVRSVGQGVLDAAKKAAGIPASDKYTTLSEITQRPKTVATVPKTTTDQINGETRPTPKPSVQVPDNVKSAIDAQKKANGGLTDAQVKEYEQMNLEEAKRGFQKELTERAAGVFEEKARAEVYKAQDAADQAEAGVNKMKADPDAGQGEIAQAQAAADRARAQADQVIAEYNKNKGVETVKIDSVVEFGKGIGDQIEDEKDPRIAEQEEAQLRRDTQNQLSVPPQYPGQGTAPSEEIVDRMKDPNTSIQDPKVDIAEANRVIENINKITPEQARLGNDVSGPAASVEQVDITDLAALSKGKYNINDIVTPEVAKKIAINNIPVLARDNFAKDIEKLTPRQQTVAGLLANQAGVQGLPVGTALGMGATETRFGTLKDRKNSEYDGPVQIGDAEFKANASDAAKQLGKHDLYANVQAGVAYMKTIEKRFEKIGIKPTAGDVYGAYNQGFGGYMSLKKSPEANAASVVAKAGKVSYEIGLQRVEQNLPKELRGKAATISAGQFADVIAKYPTDKYTKITGGTLPTGDNPGAKQQGNKELPTTQSPSKETPKKVSDSPAPKKKETIKEALEPKPNDNPIVKGIKTVVKASPTLQLAVEGLSWLEKKVGGGGKVADIPSLNNGSGNDRNDNSSGASGAGGGNNTPINAKAYTAEKNAEASFKLVTSGIKSSTVRVTDESRVSDGVSTRISKANFTVGKTNYEVAFSRSTNIADGVMDTVDKNNGTLTITTERTDVDALNKFTYTDRGTDGKLDKFAINSFELDKLADSADIQNRFKEELEVVAQTYYNIPKN